MKVELGTFLQSLDKLFVVVTLKSGSSPSVCWHVCFLSLYFCVIPVKWEDYCLPIATCI